MADLMAGAAVNQPHIVYHMLPESEWQARQAGSDYYAATLAGEGFIHCTAELPLLERVANSFYQERAGDWLILTVDLNRVAAPVRWEEAGGRLFPHIYGPIDSLAVVGVAPFPRQADGTYYLPEALR